MIAVASGPPSSMTDDARRRPDRANLRTIDVLRFLSYEKQAYFASFEKYAREIATAVPATVRAFEAGSRGEEAKARCISGSIWVPPASRRC
jgi:hypothetical protein